MPFGTLLQTSGADGLNSFSITPMLQICTISVPEEKIKRITGLFFITVATFWRNQHEKAHEWL